MQQLSASSSEPVEYRDSTFKSDSSLQVCPIPTYQTLMFPVGTDAGRTIMLQTSAALSDHAKRQAQMRGISHDIIGHIVELGDRRTWIGAGCQAVSISRREMARLSPSVLPPQLRDRAAGVAVVLSPDETAVVTVMHMQGQRGRRYRRRV